jgi:hypothetical protein
MSAVERYTNSRVLLVLAAAVALPSLLLLALWANKFVGTVHLQRHVADRW